MYSRKLALQRTRNRRWKRREEKAIALAVIGIVILATLPYVYAPEPPATTYEYIIITKDPLSDEFQILADWKGCWVNGTKVVTVSENASAEDVKSIINDYYTNHTTKYVLLGGDVEVIPYHKWYCDNYTTQFIYIAEDYWFANLDGDDEISEHEVYIGRAPVDNEEEAAHFVNKVILFEQMDKPKANLFHATMDPDYGVELANDCMQYVPSDYANYTLFEQLNDSVSYGEWKALWRNDAIMSLHYGHGMPSYVPEGYEINHYSPKRIWDIDDVFNMDNTFWPIHTSPSCDMGAFDKGDCLAEAYVKADNGAIACFMNNRIGSDYSYGFIEMQFKALYQEGYQNIGAILARSKEILINKTDPNNNTGWAGWELGWRMINLIGDPETPVLTKRVLNLNLTVLAEDQNSTSLTTGYVYIDGQYRGRTNSTYIVSPGHKVLVTDFWESGNTGWRYFFRNWTDGSEDNPRTITFVEDTTITAYFYKWPCPGEANGIVEENGNLTVTGGDQILVGNAFWTEPGDSNWDSRADVSGNEYVDGEDMIIVGNNLYEQYYPPP